MPGFLRTLVTTVALLAALLLSAAVEAQTGSQSGPNPLALLDIQSNEFAALKTQLGNNPPVAERTALRDRATAIQAKADEAVQRLVPQLDGLDKRLADLGEATENEAPDLRSQREELTKERGDIDSAIKRGRLLSTDARDATDAINRALADEFNRNTFERVASPLSPLFWHSIRFSFPRDWARLASFGSEAAAELRNGLSGSGALVVAATSLAALLLLLSLRHRLRKLGLQFAIDHAPGTRARRSGLALWFVLVGSLLATLAFLLVVQGLRWADALSDDADTLATTVMAAASFGAFVVALGAGLLLVDRPSWRLLPFNNDTASKLRPYPLMVALLAVFGITLGQVNNIVGASPTATVAANLVIALLHIAVVLSVLLTLRRTRRNDPKSTVPSPRKTLVTLAALVCWVSLAVSIFVLLQGYVNFSLFIGRQTVWIAIVAATAYLLAVVADDLCTVLLSGDGWLGRVANEGLGIRKSSVAQIGVVLSAFLRIAVVLLAISAVFAPFGPGTGSLYAQIAGLSSITLGDFTLEPGAVLRSLVVLGIGLTVLRLVRKWLNETYLPTTELDAGARNSASMIVSYVGVILAGFWALTSLGIGIERIALLVSALSVGIGFGLQAITQNFVSGLILLAERPVKIGDTVRIGTEEGDVKRISVRSTEIQIADRSTLIVPNSELITKTIRNMTLADPLGRIQITFATPIDVDVGAVRQIMIEIFGDHPGVLGDPKPSVFIDAIADGKVNFNSFAFVSGPRAVYATRSALLFTVLERFRKDGIQLHAPAAG